MSTTTTTMSNKTQKNPMFKRYTFHELRTLAKQRGVSRWYYMNKGELCSVLRIVRVEHLPKYTLTTLADGEPKVTWWRSACAISKEFGVNTGNIFYALKIGKPLVIDKVRYQVRRL